MASESEFWTTNRILVKNWPPNLTRDKLEIYFQKEKNGGRGDVKSVTLQSFGDGNASIAVVEFEAVETVKSVLSKQHQLFGYQLEIQPFPEQDFGACDVVINKSTVTKLKHVENWQSKLQECAGVTVENKNGVFHLKGEWYQVEAAMAVIKVESTRTHALAKARTPAFQPTQQQYVPSETIPADEHMYRYYHICYSDKEKSILKKYKVTLRYENGQILFVPSQKGPISQPRDAAVYFINIFTEFRKSVMTQLLDISNFPMGSSERNEAIKAAMADGRVYVGCSRHDSQNNRVTFLAIDPEHLREAIDVFHNECMPLKNEVLATFGVEGKMFKVTVVHGDFQQQDGNVILLETSVQGDCRIPASCRGGLETVRRETQKALSQNRSLFGLPIVTWKTKCTRVTGFIVQQNQNGETDYKKVLSAAIESISLYGKKGVLPVFKENSCNVSSADFVGMIASALRRVSTSTNCSDIYLVHNNHTEARKLIEYLTAAKKFRLLKKKDSDSASTKSSEEEVCSICLDELRGAVSMKTLECKHTFHQACIDKAFSVSMKCPLCMRFYGKVEGNQPKNGTMRTAVKKHYSLPGYPNCGTIEIHYHFPSGMQGTEHPSPGMQYRGTSRLAYLPDNAEGRELLLLLRKAFEARITFTVGRSVTTGANNVVTWNDIHHKTSMTGGPQNYGYPDPTYLSRLKMELADKGIS